jgi:molecular chaperone Hsp33
LAQAGLNNNAVAPIRATDRIYDLSTLLGDGHLAFTVDQGDFTDRYQGIVALAGPDLVACVGHYFSQSEQIDTILHIAAGETEDGLRAGGLMIQRLPLPATSDPEAVDRAQEDWDRAQALAATLTREELIREPLPANDLLYRLFHEEGVRVYNPVQLRKGCRCHGDRLSAILKTMPADDLAHMTVDGAIVMTCEFCNKDFHFRPDDLSAIPKP